MEKLKDMGNRALALPLGIALVVFCVLGVAVAPMMHMAPRNVPVAAYGIVACFGGIDVPAQAILLLWFASACVMLANLGLLGITVPLGTVVMVCAFALGMATAVLPPEMLPPFWADWVCPWAPQAAQGDGLRNIIYLGGGAFDAGVPVLAAWGCVGIVALIISALVPTRARD